MMQHYELQRKNNMEKAESAVEQLHVCTETTAESCTKLFSIRQYVYLSRQKNIFQNWPFPEKYLKSCLEYGVTNVLPPLEARVVLERTSISCDKGNVANVGNDHDTSVEATISMKSERFQLVTLSCNDQKQEEENPSDVLSPCYRYMNEVTPISPSVISVREGNKTRKWRRKMKTMAEIFATAKHCTLEEVDEMNDLSCTSVTALDIDGEHRRKNQVDFEYFDSKSELTDDGADCNNRLSKRMPVLKSWSRIPSSSFKSTDLITKNRTKGCNRRTRTYDSKSSFELQDAYIFMSK